MPFLSTTPPFAGTQIGDKTIMASQVSGLTNEAKITTAIARAVAIGALYVYIPTRMLPYDASKVTFNNSVKLVREGGDFANYDVQAYGAAGDSVTDDSTEIQAAINACVANGGGKVYFAKGIYYTGTTTLTIAAGSVTLEYPAGIAGYIKYAGTGYAVDFNSGDGVTKLNLVRCLNVGVVCTNPAGSAFRLVRCLYSRLDHCYAENGIAGVTGSGYVLDGTGIFSTNVIFNHCRSNNFFIGFDIRSGAAGEVVTNSSIVDCFVNGEVGQANTIGVKFGGASGCQVIRGHYEILDYGIKLVTVGANRNVDITMDTTTMESINTNEILIPSDSTGCVLINPPSANLINNAAPDTVIQGTPYVLSRSMGEKLSNLIIPCVNGANGVLSIGNYKKVQLTGPTGAFSITGFTSPFGPTSGSVGGADGRELEVEYLGAQALTVIVGDAPAALASIRSLSADGGANVVCGTPFGVYLQFRYNAAQGQWILMNKR